MSVACFRDVLSKYVRFKDFEYHFANADIAGTPLSTTTTRIRPLRRIRLQLSMIGRLWGLLNTGPNVFLMQTHRSRGNE